MSTTFATIALPLAATAHSLSAAAHALARGKAVAEKEVMVRGRVVSAKVVDTKVVVVRGTLMIGEPTRGHGHMDAWTHEHMDT